MDVLVIGGTGFLSSAIVRQLREAGHEVTIFTRGERPVPQGLRLITGDRRERDAFVERLRGERFDAVVDCICYARGEAAGLVDAFAGSGPQLVLVSTDFVYGSDRTLPMDEETPRRALNSYGARKAECEDVLLGASQEGRVAATVFRPPHIMGPGGQLGSGSLQGRDPMLIDRLRQRVPVPLLDGGALLLQPVFHEDIGRACVSALGLEVTFGQAYNVAGPTVITTRQYYELLARALDVPLSVRSVPSAALEAAFPDRAPFAQHRTYRVDKLERDTGYRPATDFTHALFSTLEWLQATGADQPYAPTVREEALLALCARFESEAAKVMAEGV
jgi:nucleoside-diphosphate-sugar epimerase